MVINNGKEVEGRNVGGVNRFGEFFLNAFLCWGSEVAAAVMIFNAIISGC